MTEKHSSTTTLIVAMHVLSREIKSEDGISNAAIAEAGRRLGKLQAMVNQAYPIIKAQYDAEHMIDGLDGIKPRPDIDNLLAEFESERI